MKSTNFQITSAQKKEKSEEVEEKSQHFPIQFEIMKKFHYTRRIFFQSLSLQSDDIHKERDFYDFKWVLLFASIK